MTQNIANRANLPGRTHADAIPNLGLTPKFHLTPEKIWPIGTPRALMLYRANPGVTDPGWYTRGPRTAGTCVDDVGVTLFVVFMMAKYLYVFWCLVFFSVSAQWDKCSCTRETEKTLYRLNKSFSLRTSSEMTAGLSLECCRITSSMPRFTASMSSNDCASESCCINFQ